MKSRPNSITTMGNYSKVNPFVPVMFAPVAYDFGKILGGVPDGRHCTGDVKMFTNKEKPF